jgi:monovalent cation:H+ antiporter-2, CPA2 family
MRDQLANAVRRFAFQRSFARRECTHLSAVGDVRPGALVCPSCEERGDRWVHLRMCLTCGAVGCCDSSRERHARAHFEATGHPLMRSIEPGEEWAWCYPDRAFLASVQASPQ